LPHPDFCIPTFQERFQMNRFNQPRSLFARVTDVRRLLPLAVAAGLVVAMPLQAENAPQPQAASPEQAAPPAATPEQNKQMQEIQRVHAEYMELQKHITQIQNDTLQAHPELKTEEESLRNLVLEKMSSSGKSAKEDMNEIIKLEEKLRSGDTPEDEREALMGEYQKKAIAFRSAQNEAMKNPEVQAAQKKFMENVMTAMKEKDPQVEQLMQQMQEKQQQLSEMMKSAGHMQ
jgi:chromosome segregation ATPase